MNDTTTMNHILFGAAYYDEYMPVDRLDKDVAMLKAAHMNVVRIAESTWSTMEPQPGVFDFSHIDRVIDAMEAAGIDVIIGTPTYAVPSWLTLAYPDILVRTHEGNRGYGARQIMDISNAAYRFHAERAIRALISHVAERKAVIGYQVDNETKHYDVVSHDVQRAFVKYLRTKFSGDLDAMNRAFGLDYWSNRIDAWEDVPDATDTINGSLAGAFDEFRRSLVTEFIGWQASIVREYAREDQFVTQNYDLEWRGHSFGVQPWADDFKTSEHLDYAGVDIYHPTESHLTGREIGFGGDLTRSFKDGRNYLLLETQAQGQNGWLPYPGQLRLQAYSHLASGSNSVMYWHWHSIHNSFETYWKGVLSHDFEPNPVYEEAGVFGGEVEHVGGRLVNLRKHNRVAIMVSQASLSALSRFTIPTGFPDPYPYSEQQSGLTGYNDVLRWIYDRLFDMNIECDFVTEEAPAERLAEYDVLIAPALYAVPEVTVQAVRAFVERGGRLIATFKSFVADEHVKVAIDRQPRGLTDVFGMHYNQFTLPEGDRLALRGAWAEGLAGAGDAGVGAGAAATGEANVFMELLEPADGAEVLATYARPEWSRYAAIVRNRFGQGSATWIGTMADETTLAALLADEMRAAGLWGWAQEAPATLRVRRGTNDAGEQVTYLLNYSGETVALAAPFDATDLLADRPVKTGETLEIGPWGVTILVQ